jgi:hypothetical protein
MLEDAFFGSDFRRLKSFALAAAVALLATQGLAEFGVVDLSRSIYLTSSIGFGGAIIGGLMFGVGMALVGTCGFGTLVRVGGGDLRAIVVFLVLGLSALATMRGITGVLRVMLGRQQPDADLAARRGEHDASTPRRFDCRCACLLGPRRWQTNPIAAPLGLRLRSRRRGRLRLVFDRMAGR